MTRNRATAIGFIAVLLFWALLALFTVGSPRCRHLLNAICFLIGGTFGLIWCAARRRLGRLRQVPMQVDLLGTIALFGYHTLYFSALRLAPPAQASLIAYLWPLFIVLFSGLLPGKKLGLGHIIGALIAFLGAALIVGKGGISLDGTALPGLGLAFLCALTWSGYSVLSHRIGTVPTESVAVFCLATAVLSAMAHLALEFTLWPSSALGLASCIALGLGPVGAAFYVWDIDVKLGDIQLLGTASYAAPLLSTLKLILTEITAPLATILFAAALIAGGAGLAAWASARHRKTAPERSHNLSAEAVTATPPDRIDAQPVLSGSPRLSVRSGGGSPLSGEAFAS